MLLLDGIILKNEKSKYQLLTEHGMYNLEIKPELKNDVEKFLKTNSIVFGKYNMDLDFEAEKIEFKKYDFTKQLNNHSLVNSF